MIKVWQQDNVNMFQIGEAPPVSLAESLGGYSTLHAIKEAVEKGIVEAVSAERAEGDHALASLRSQLTLAESDRDAFKAQLDALPAAKVKS
jgi:hypothetical protein